MSLASKMVESLKSQAVHAQIYEGREPIQFFSIFQNFIVLRGGVSSGYKSYIAENGMADETYSEDGIALFRVQGSGPYNMQAVQVEPVASSLNSSCCYILHNGNTVFTWSGSLTTTKDLELVERQLDLIKPNLQSKPQKEGSESEQFWSLLGGKSEYRSQKIVKDAESDPHLFSCNFSKGVSRIHTLSFSVSNILLWYLVTPLSIIELMAENLKVTEIFNFSQDDLMTEDIFILDCHSSLFVWVGQQLDSKIKMQALNIGKKYVEQDFLLEKLSHETPIFIIMEGNEPAFFTCFFTWDSAKSAMQGNSFQRKLSIVKDGFTPTLDNPKRRTPTSYVGRSTVPDKSQRSRSMSFSPERVRARGRSPAFSALAANFENPDLRNLSTPPPVARKVYPKSVTPDSAKLAPRSTAIAALSASFGLARENIVPRPLKVLPEANKPKLETNGIGNNLAGSRIETLTIHEDVKEGEGEDEVGLLIYPYERLKTTSTDPVTEIDVTKREVQCWILTQIRIHEY
ncbi:hypothetical protein Taro_019164 [Colocasia esculenta]|uniref:Gelsolin-like domain-containing protein n=1 Tax=Colocasia esculenta TaxID=4460 RepID=A0A843V4N7_COLES|nr:hypothetical protein [Colocasia esculenta]